MANDTVGIRLGVDGEKAFHDSIKAVNAQIKSLGAEMAAVTASFTKNANSQEALAAKNEVLGRSIESQKSKIDVLNKQIERQKEVLNALGDTLDKTSAEYDEQSDQAAKAQNAYNSQSKVVNDLTAQLHKAEAELSGMSGAMEENNAALEEITKNSSEFASDLEEFGDNAKGAETGISQLASALAAAGIAGTVKEIGAAIRECVNAFAGFDAQMSTVQAISGATASEMDLLSGKAKQMGATTSFTATQAGQAFEYMAMAGWKTEDMMNGLDGIMSLAAATGEDLAKVSDIVTDALTAFGLAASDSKRFADVLAAASTNSNTNVRMMGETFKYVASVAGALGYTIEDTALAIGLMANAGIKSTQAGSALRAVMTNLAKPSKTVAEYMEKLDVSLTDSSGQMRPLAELLRLLRSRFAELTEAEKAEYAAGIAGKEAMSGLLAIVNAAEEDYDKLAGAIRDSNDAAQKMSEIRMDNYAGQVTRLNSALDGLKIAVGEQLTPALGKMAEVGAGSFSWATEFVEDNPWIIGAITGLVAALGSLSIGVAALSAGPAIIGALNSAIAALTANPLVAIAAAAAGVVVALGTMAAAASEAGSEAKDLAKSLQKSKDAYDELVHSIDEEQKSVSSTISSLKDLLAVERKSAAQKEIIAQKVETLNESIPGLSLAYDAERDSINMTNEALEAMAEKLAGQEQHSAQVARLNELYSEQASLTAQITEAQALLDEALAAARWDSFGGAMNDAAFNVQTLQGDLSILTAAQEANAAQVAELETVTGQYAEQVANANSGLTDMTPVIEMVNEQLQGLSAAYLEVYDEAMNSINAQLGLFREVDGTAKTSIGNLIDTLKGQVSYMETYAENIRKAMEIGVDEGLVQKLSDGSEESAQILAAIVKGGEEDIAALNKEFAKVEEGKEAFSTTVADLKTDFDEQLDLMMSSLEDAISGMDKSNEAYTVGENNIKGLINGANSLKKDLIAQYRAMGKAAIDAYKQEVDQHSPSKAFQQAGHFDIQGLIYGAEHEKNNLESSYSHLGKTAANGMISGMEDGNSAVANAAEQLSNDIYRISERDFLLFDVFQAKQKTKESLKYLFSFTSDAIRALWSNTPELGRQFSENFAEGIQSGMENVVASAASVAKAAADALSRTLSVDVPALSADIAPTITMGRGSREEQIADMLSHAVQAASNGPGRIDYTDLGRTVYDAIQNGLNGMGVYLQDRKVGKMISDWQSNENMAMGR